MASDRMLQFVEREQSYPDKRSAEERARDFHEIAERYAAPDADAQAARCSQCGVPYCSVHCPLHNHIPDWLRLTAEGRLREAYELSNATSTMPEIRSEEHTSELQSLMRISYAVFCLNKKNTNKITSATTNTVRRRLHMSTTTSTNTK